MILSLFCFCFFVYFLVAAFLFISLFACFGFRVCCLIFSVCLFEEVIKWKRRLFLTLKFCLYLFTFGVAFLTLRFSLSCLGFRVNINVNTCHFTWISYLFCN